MLYRLIRTTDDPALLPLRLALGLVMLAHGVQKAFGWFNGFGFEATLGFFASIGVPTPVALLVIALETVGALALMAGFFGRLMALGHAAIMLSAVLLIHLENGFYMNWDGAQAGAGIEFLVLATAIALTIFIKGSGAWSLDRLLARSQGESATPARLATASARQRRLSSPRGRAPNRCARPIPQPAGTSGRRWRPSARRTGYARPSSRFALPSSSFSRTASFTSSPWKSASQRSGMMNG
jgi:putative oxidoreductase